MDDKYDFLKSIIEMDPFLKHVGIKVISLEDGYAKLSMEFREEITRLGNIANGGAIATLADAAGGASVLTLLSGKNHVTISLNMEYLEPVENGPVIGEGKIERKGKHLIFSSINIFDGNGKLCAHAQGIYFLKDF
ncbi:MAG: PaaI family thioesterase [Thermoplasmata archaeon]|nr:PaaI family thioesterase [Thermoplasmata archaeon]